MFRSRGEAEVVPARDPVAAFDAFYLEPNRTKIREAAYRLACAVTDAIPSRTTSRADQEELVLARLLEACLPAAKTIRLSGTGGER